MTDKTSRLEQRLAGLIASPAAEPTGPTLDLFHLSAEDQRRLAADLVVEDPL